MRVQVLMLHNVVSVGYAPYPKCSVKVVHRVIQCLPVCHSVTQFAQGHTVLDNISVEFRRKNILVNLHLQTQSSVMQQARVFFPEATSNQPPIFPHWPALPIQKQKLSQELHRLKLLLENEKSLNFREHLQDNSVASLNKILNEFFS